MSEKNKRDICLLIVGCYMVDYAIKNKVDIETTLIFILLFSLAKLISMHIDDMADNRRAFEPGM